MKNIGIVWSWVSLPGKESSGGGEMAITQDQLTRVQTILVGNDKLGQLDQDERDELNRLRALINSPLTDDWMTAVNYEAAHQQERWGAEHDEGKNPEDWFWLLGRLAGKAVQAFTLGDTKKGLHHIISSSAAMLNWHRNVTGQNTGMRPGTAELPGENNR